MDTEFDLEVRTHIPVRQYKLLHKVATHNATTVAALVAELVRRALTDGAPPQPRPTRRRATTETLNELVRLNQAGKSDNEIARVVRMSPAWVNLHRKKLGLPANGKRHD